MTSHLWRALFGGTVLSVDGMLIADAIEAVTAYSPFDNAAHRSLLRVLTTNPALSRPGSLLVLIGRQTFSAAVLLATELDKQTNAVFIGEPTGGSPNLYGNPRPLQLPNSKIVVNVSSKYFEVGGPNDHREAIVPDIAATTSLDDLLAGRDPVLDAAIALAGP